MRLYAGWSIAAVLLRCACEAAAANPESVENPLLLAQKEPEEARGPEGPAAKALKPAQFYGYAMCNQSSTMLVIDTSTNTVVRRVRHAEFVRSAWGRFHPNKKRYYAGGIGKVTVWDTTDLSNPIHIKTVTPAGSSASGEYRGVFIYGGTALANTPDGEVWFTNTTDQTINIYTAADLEAGAAATPTPVKVFTASDGIMRPHYMQRRPGTDEVWISNRHPAQPGYMLRVNGSNKAILTAPTQNLVTTGINGDEPTEFSFNKDGSLAYIGHHGNPITGSPAVVYDMVIADAATFTVKKTLKTVTQEQTPGFMDMDNDRGLAYFVAKWGPTLVVVDQKTERVLRYITLGGFGPAYGVATTPDYKKIYVSLGSPAQSGVTVIDAHTLTVDSNIIEPDCDNPRSVRFTHY